MTLPHNTFRQLEVLQFIALEISTIMSPFSPAAIPDLSEKVILITGGKLPPFKGYWAGPRTTY